MGIRFEGNVLIQTITWTVLSWDNVRELITDKHVRRIIDNKDKEGLKSILRDLVPEINYLDLDGVDLERIIDDLADDILTAEGSVVIAEGYPDKDILIALFEEFIRKYLY